MQPGDEEQHAEQAVHDGGDAGERFGVHRAALLDDVHRLALVPCLAQVRDEVVVVGMPDERGEHPAAEALVGVLAQEILREFPNGAEEHR